MRRRGWYAGLAVLAGACTATLDAGHNRTPDPCATRDAASSACPPTGLLDNLIGYWRLDDGTGSSVVYDSSGRGNDGTLHGVDPGSAWAAGRSQGALELAHAGWVRVAPSPSIDSITDHITLSAWVNPESAVGIDGWATALSRQTGTGNNQHYHIALHAEAQPSLFLITVDGYALIRPAETVPMGVWTHLAGVYDGAVARLYVNGVEAGSQALTGRFGADTTPVILGGNGNDDSGVPTELFPGRIDEVMLYARALSAIEIGQLAAGALFSAGSRDAGSD
jgi:beta-galactosidase